MLCNEVLNTIPQYVQKNKSLARLFMNIGLVFGVVALVGISSFYLGRIMTHMSLQCPLAIDIEPFTSPQTTSLYVSEKTETKIQPQKTEVSIGSGAGGVVVSKNGTKYHFPWCAGAGQIKEENKIWYATEKDAQSAGYTKAGNCQ